LRLLLNRRGGLPGTRLRLLRLALRLLLPLLLRGLLCSLLHFLEDALPGCRFRSSHGRQQRPARQCPQKNPPHNPVEEALARYLNFRKSCYSSDLEIFVKFDFDLHATPGQDLRAPYSIEEEGELAAVDHQQTWAAFGFA
jgi:hypothetical protein